VRLRLSRPDAEGRSAARSAFDEGAAISVFPETRHSQVSRLSREPGAVHADLAKLILHHTVLPPTGVVRLTYGPRREEPVVGGATGPTDPVRLTDGRYLRLTIQLFFEDTPQGRRAKVKMSSFQYQLDSKGERWIFRYDYVREPPAPHPAMHLQIRGTLKERRRPDEPALERIHFPTHRVSLEAVIRLLIEQFGTPAREPPEVWRALLAQTEAAFLAIAHRTLSGPAR
jgi:hypothetical protein